MVQDKHDIVVRLREAVEAGSGELVRDGRLATERELTAAFGVTRRVVRGALEILENEGLVFRRQGQGTFTRPTAPHAPRVATLANHTSPAEIMEVRREIEPALCAISAFRATPTDIDQMRRLIERGADARTSEDYERWDSAFHARIAESVRNSLFESLFQLIQAVRVEHKWTALRAQTFNESIRDELVLQHCRIIDAIASRDPDAAADAMRTHLLSVSRVIGN